ncbi:myelin-associated glycoprotein-like [Leptodactylus fuscus]|uniref:myelin-associated glycoprotein-like n=1 Tax=Leptodactylus fuscus TaxID=238119 RepID=UPI003F4E9140
MESMKQIYLLLLCQGFYLGSVGQQWTFPSMVNALIGSCVEIPCKIHPKETSRKFSTVWYIHNKKSNPEVLNTKNSSSVIEDYKARTSRVPGENSCTLRIDPVRRGDENKYYPGIAEDKDITAYKTHSRVTYLYVTDNVNIQLHWFDSFTEGEAATIRCSVDHTCRSSPPSLQWNKPGQVKKKSVENYEGSWREESELTYIPSYVDDGSSVQCTATYPNGQRTERSRTLDINYGGSSISKIILPAVIGTICLLPLVLLVYTLECPDVTYSDLIKADVANDYEPLKPLRSTNISITGGQFPHFTHLGKSQGKSE